MTMSDQTPETPKPETHNHERLTEETSYCVCIHVAREGAPIFVHGIPPCAWMVCHACADLVVSGAITEDLLLIVCPECAAAFLAKNGVDPLLAEIADEVFLGHVLGVPHAQ